MPESVAIALPDALLDPRAYPPGERPERVRLAETHVSWLFFTGPFVYKVKKPVDYGFLNFTHLEQRRHYCEEEVRLNRRLSPDVYLGVVEIRATDGGVMVGGAGTILDYAVKMRQLPDDRWLSRLLARGEATAALVRRIARRIADFHAIADRGDEITRLGGTGVVRGNTEENFTQTRDYVGVTLAPEVYDVVRAYTRAFLEVRRPLLERREREGRIRDCHGDLHADQICVEDGIAFIDCIEFNTRFRYSDVAADIAFTAMDLDRYGRPELGRAFVEEYVAASADPGVWSVLDFYKCYRAYTRGKVRSFRLRESLTDEVRAEIAADASGYFELAARYARLPAPLLVITAGLMGTGKSTVARGLAPRLRAELFASDVVRKELAGITPQTPRREAWGAGIYSAEASRRTYETLHERADRTLAEGHSVVLDASYREASWRAAAHDIAVRRGARLLVVETACPEPVARRRLGRRRPGMSPSDGRLELYDVQRRHYQPPTELSRDDVFVADTTASARDTLFHALLEIYRRCLGPG